MTSRWHQFWGGAGVGVALVLATLERLLSLRHRVVDMGGGFVGFQNREHWYLIVLQAVLLAGGAVAVWFALDQRVGPRRAITVVATLVLLYALIWLFPGLMDFGPAGSGQPGWSSA